MRGDPQILIKTFSENFSLRDAMAAAGYGGRGGFSAAAADIESRGEELCALILECHGGRDFGTDKRSRILAECAEIAFAPPGSEVKTADKLRALDMYLRLSENGEDANDYRGITVICDYGDGDFDGV